MSSPLTDEEVVVGSNEMPMEEEEIVPWEKRLSVTVGIVVEAEERVPAVKSTGPILDNERLIRREGRRGGREGYPRIPSTPEKPWDVDATPMDWFWMTRPVPRVTVSVSAFHEKGYIQQ